MSRKMIVVDLDGTLLDINKKISDKTRNYLFDLKKKGYIIVIATGRILDSAIYITNGALFADYIISNSGGIIYDNFLKKIIFKNVITKDTVNKICDLYNEDINYIELCDSHYYYKYTNKDYKELGFSRNILDKDLFIKTTEVVHMSISANKNIDLLFKYLNDNFDDIGTFMMYDSFDHNDKWIEIAGLNINKFNAIKMLADKEDVLVDNIIAFGDSNNDIDMIKNVGIGVAMENAVDSVKEVANYITKSHNEDGIVLFLENYLSDIE